MIERDGKAVYIDDKDLAFIIDYKGAGIKPEDHSEAVNTMKERILGGNGEYLSYFFQNNNIPQNIRREVFNAYNASFALPKMDWDLIIGMFLAPDKRQYICRFIPGTNNVEDVTQEIVAAQLKFAIAALPKADTCLDSWYAEPLKRRFGNAVESAYFSDMEGRREEKKKFNIIPELGKAELEKLEKELRLTVVGRDGKQYLLKCDGNRVHAYRTESLIPRECEEAILDNFIAKAKHGRREVYELFEVVKSPEFEQWHKQKVWNAAIGKVSIENMHSLYDFIDEEKNYPAEWVQQAKTTLQGLQGGYLQMLHTEELTGNFSTLNVIYSYAQSQEIKQQAYGMMKGAYAEKINAEIEKGQNIDYECRDESVPKAIRDGIGKPRLLESYRAQIKRAMKDPQIFWWLERMRDGTDNFKNTPEIIRKEAEQALEEVVKATVRGMWDVRIAEKAPKPEPVASIVEDKKETVKELGKNITKQPSKYWIPRTYHAVMAAIKKQ